LFELSSWDILLPTADTPFSYFGFFFLKFVLVFSDLPQRRVESVSRARERWWRGADRFEFELA
jgi:hypothetical protein